MLSRRRLGRATKACHASPASHAASLDLNSALPVQICSARNGPDSQRVARTCVQIREANSVLLAGRAGLGQPGSASSCDGPSKGSVRPSPPGSVWGCPAGTGIPLRPDPLNPAFLAALISPEAMQECAELMLLIKPNGPHQSGLETVGMQTPTNAALEVVRATARWLWLVHEAQLKKLCPCVYDEEVARGFLLGDALGNRPTDEEVARVLGKRAATQIASTTNKAAKAAKAARRGPAASRGPGRRGRGGRGCGVGGQVHDADRQP